MTGGTPISGNRIVYYNGICHKAFDFLGVCYGVVQSRLYLKFAGFFFSGEKDEPENVKVYNLSHKSDPTWRFWKGIPNRRAVYGSSFFIGKAIEFWCTKCRPNLRNIHLCGSNWKSNAGPENLAQCLSFEASMDWFEGKFAANQSIDTQNLGMLRGARLSEPMGGSSLQFADPSLWEEHRRCTARWKFDHVWSMVDPNLIEAHVWIARVGLKKAVLKRHRFLRLMCPTLEHADCFLGLHKLSSHCLLIFIPN